MKYWVMLAVSVFVIVALRSADWSGFQVVWVGLVLLAVCSTGLMLWHRRKLAELHSLAAEVVGGWRRVYHGRPWPKYCLYCGQSAYSWPQARIHRDSPGSPCAALSVQLGAAEAQAGPEPVLHVDAEAVMGGVDTLTDEPPLELPASVEHGLAAAWERIDGLIGRTTGRS